MRTHAVAEPREKIEEGHLNPMDRRHTCPRCGDVAEFMGTRVYPNLIVFLFDGSGHQWPAYLDELPAGVLAGHGAAV
jgi:hypothetical protein